MTLFVVIGPPAAGKSTWVNDRAQPGDIVIDYDRLANALTAINADPHNHKRPLATVAFHARETAITQALRHVATHNVYIIHSVPKPAALKRYADHGGEIVTVDPGREVVEARCRTERPENYMDGVKRWYRTHAPRVAAPALKSTPGTTPAKGNRSRDW